MDTLTKHGLQQWLPQEVLDNAVVLSNVPIEKYVARAVGAATASPTQAAVADMVLPTDVSPTQTWSEYADHMYGEAQVALSGLADTTLSTEKDSKSILNSMLTLVAQCVKQVVHGKNLPVDATFRRVLDDRHGCSSSSSGSNSWRNNRTKVLGTADFVMPVDLQLSTVTQRILPHIDDYWVTVKDDGDRRILVLIYGKLFWVAREAPYTSIHSYDNLKQSHSSEFEHIPLLILDGEWMSSSSSSNDGAQQQQQQPSFGIHRGSGSATTTFVVSDILALNHLNLVPVPLSARLVVCRHVVELLNKTTLFARGRDLRVYMKHYYPLRSVSSTLSPHIRGLYSTDLAARRSIVQNGHEFAIDGLILVQIHAAYTPGFSESVYKCKFTHTMDVGISNWDAMRKHGSLTFVFPAGPSRATLQGSASLAPTGQSLMTYDAFDYGCLSPLLCAKHVTIDTVAAHFGEYKTSAATTLVETEVHGFFDLNDAEQIHPNVHGVPPLFAKCYLDVCTAQWTIIGLTSQGPSAAAPHVTSSAYAEPTSSVHQTIDILITRQKQKANFRIVGVNTSLNRVTLAYAVPKIGTLVSKKQQPRNNRSSSVASAAAASSKSVALLQTQSSWTQPYDTATGKTVMDVLPFSASHLDEQALQRISDELNYNPGKIFECGYNKIQGVFEILKTRKKTWGNFHSTVAQCLRILASELSIPALIQLVDDCVTKDADGGTVSSSASPTPLPTPPPSLAVATAAIATAAIAAAASPPRLKSTKRTKPPVTEAPPKHKKTKR